MEDSANHPVEVNTYHCICTTLVLAIPYKLDSLPARAAPAQDQSAILPLTAKTDANTESRLQNITEDRKHLVVRREDGFEKRTILRCNRCHLVIGYKLAEDSSDANVAYILPGGLVTTDDMQKGNTPPTPAWATEKA
ncbi:uncharacterized protein HMPREF1541_00921 [Cyphellophora europaea CBS 101466]|uniref:STEEP1 domain-containing protein n=1 Tax=Cyphellophora europaea (strain CBS 101466) TaxID=1220924 RepID=W2SDF5_CYPE1|nr:uncharacterized protein HMPREF1541_00921 [Cyphellophora europaea CBS 101466]ETN46732.1 hypothetical protein HMPREF1541_00921 [Cyphellophora europaea CBS 101466]